VEPNFKPQTFTTVSWMIDKLDCEIITFHSFFKFISYIPDDMHLILICRNEGDALNGPPRLDHGQDPTRIFSAGSEYCGREMAAGILQPARDQLRHGCPVHDSDGIPGTTDPRITPTDQTCFVEDSTFDQSAYPGSLALFP
tara:strand:+ start:328 stop:750 length:423 start_codon:yes stop_codon:yes gene_type:complete